MKDTEIKSWISENLDDWTDGEDILNVEDEDDRESLIEYLYKKMMLYKHSPIFAFRHIIYDLIYQIEETGNNSQESIVEIKIFLLCAESYRTNKNNEN